MENVFSKNEVLISCSSLRNLDLKKHSLNKGSAQSVIMNSKLAKLLMTRVNNLVEENASRTSERIAQKYELSKTTDIGRLITEILLARRYRGGKRKESSPDVIYQKVKDRMKKGLPIRLTFSLFPCKIPNLLKNGGELADMGEVASLARMKEIAISVKKVYPPGLQIIILMDGYRFKDILNFPPAIIEKYQHALTMFHELLKAEDTVILQDYTETLSKKISSDKLAEKKRLFYKIKSEYKATFGKNIDLDRPLAYLDSLLEASDDQELTKKFISLYMSLIYCSYVPEIMESAKRDLLSLEVFENVFDFNSPKSKINRLRRDLVSHTWLYTINYISEITAGRMIKPIEMIYPDSIRCDMHNISGRLTLYPVNRSTKLSSFHSTGYIDRKGKISVNFRLLLENSNYLPIYGTIFGKEYYRQAFGYIDKRYLDKFNGKFGEQLVNSLLLK